MTKEQADWIMAWLEDLQERLNDKDANSSAEQAAAQAAIESVQKNSEALQSIAAAVQEKRADTVKMTSGDNPQLAKITKSLHGLVDSMSQLQREQFRLSKRIEELQARASAAGNQMTNTQTTSNSLKPPKTDNTKSSQNSSRK